MELASLLVESGAHVHWITAKHMELVVTDPVVQALEVKLKTRGVQAKLPSSPTTLTFLVFLKQNEFPWFLHCYQGLVRNSHGGSYFV